MDEVTKVISDFKNGERKMYARINHKTFEADILKPIYNGKIDEELIGKWIFLADGVQIPMVVTDDDGNDVITSPGLFDNTIALEIEEDRELNDAVIASSKTTNPASKRRVADKLGNVLKHLKNSKWPSFIEEYEKHFGTKMNDDVKQQITTNTGGVEIEDYDI